MWRWASGELVCPRREWRRRCSGDQKDKRSGFVLSFLRSEGERDLVEHREKGGLDFWIPSAILGKSSCGD